jgi:hypothetical protein
MPLAEYAGVKPLYGIKAGLNEAFLVDTHTRDRLVGNDPGCAEIIKPYLRGQDIERWWSPPSGLHMIMLKSSSDHHWPWADASDEAEAEKRFAAAYPSLHAHMKSWESFVDPNTGKSHGLRYREDQGTTALTSFETGLMTPTATQLKLRLDLRRRWFDNEWLFKWHHIGGQREVEIDMFDGRMARYAGVGFDGSPRHVFWDAITRGVRKEVVEQFAWIEDRVRAYTRAPAEAAIDECAGLLTAFVQSVRRAAVQKDRILRGDGLTFPPEQDAGVWIDVSPDVINLQAKALKAALFPPQTDDPILRPPPTRGPAGAAIESTSRMPTYQVALSFAGEQRDYVEAVARALRLSGIAVFYDQFEAVTLWGKDGVEFFHKLFAADTAYVVMFISKEYVAKEWTRHERRAALSRAIAEEGEYVLPVRFDDSAVPGLPDTVQYLRAKDYRPAALAALISKKIGISPLTAKASDVSPPE